MRQKVVIILSFILLNCATIINKGKTKLIVNTIPDSCEVYLNNKYVGITPLKIKIDYDDYTHKKNILLIKKEGYLPEKLFLYKRFEPGYIFANFLFSGLIGGGLGALIGGIMAPASNGSIGNPLTGAANSLNILFNYMEKGMLIGFSTFFILSLIMDYQTGSFYYLSPDSINIKLEEKK